MTDLLRSAVELRAALRSREVSVREIAVTALERAEAATEFGAFITLTADAALADAEEADERAAGSGPDAALPPLHGMPIAHKDLTDVRGIVTTQGSAALPRRAAEKDAPGVAILRRAGAVSLGKTQVPEFGLTGYSENLIARPARNPLDPARTAGGSSGGSAAAVAAGLLPFAPGSDGGGSVRIPALACGLVGLKPGLGTLPGDPPAGAVDEFGAPRLAVAGPLARTAADAALLFDAMRGAAPRPRMERDPGAGRAPEARPASALEAVRRADDATGLRIATSTASPFDSAFPIGFEPAALEAFAAAASALSNHGHRVEEAAFTYDPGYPDAFTSAWTAGLSRMRLSSEQERRLVPYTRFWRDRALTRGDAEHLAAGAALRRFAESVRGQWGRYDVVLTPGLVLNPPLVGEFLGRSPEEDYRLQCEWAPFTSMVNVAGLPAVAVPILRTAEGLSMGVQLIGRQGAEVLLLQLAAQLTRTRRGSSDPSR